MQARATGDRRYSLWLEANRMLPAGATKREALAARDAMLARHGGDLRRGWNRSEESWERHTFKPNTADEGRRQNLNTP